MKTTFGSKPLVKNAINNLSQVMDWKYFLRFAGVLVVLYSFNYLYCGLITNSGKIYSPFLDKYLNHLTLIRIIVLNISNGMSHLIGLDSAIYGDILKTPNSPGVQMGGPCSGINIIIFWTVFVAVTQKDTWQKKLLWIIGGIAALCFINAIRITALLYAREVKVNLNEYMDNHTLFNYATYVLLIGLVWFYTSWYDKRNSKKQAVVAA